MKGFKMKRIASMFFSFILVLSLCFSTNIGFNTISVEAASVKLNKKNATLNEANYFKWRNNHV